MENSSEKNDILNSSLEAKVKEINNENIILEFNNGQKLSWPVNTFAKKIRQGDRVTLFLLSQNLDRQKDNGFLKTLLNELLKTDS